MRINKYVAQATGIGRRVVDVAIVAGRVRVNGLAARAGQDIANTDSVTLDGKILAHQDTTAQTIMLNKPAGYVVSRNGQGSRTIYDLLPAEYHLLKPVGRLDKDSSGLLLLTSDGQLAYELTHPSRQKQKVYEVMLDKPLTQEDIGRTQRGIILDDGPSKLTIQRLSSNTYRVTMHEGRNRQIRRTFAALGYKVTKLHRTHFGPYTLGSLRPGTYEALG